MAGYHPLRPVLDNIITMKATLQDKRFSSTLKEYKLNYCNLELCMGGQREPESGDYRMIYGGHDKDGYIMA